MALQRGKTFLAASAAVKYTFQAGVASTPKTVTQATALTDKIVGIANAAQPDVGEEVDVIVAGETKLILGGTVHIGDRLTADTNGYGVAVSSGISNIGAIAMEYGVSGDIIPVDVQLSQVKLS